MKMDVLNGEYTPKHSGLLPWIRSRLGAVGRRRVRALTDPFSGPFGSIRSVHTHAPLVALTFDDGPDPAHTPGILDALGAYGAKATWFVLLDRAEANPALLKRILAEGHDVGLHGIDHRRLTNLRRGDLVSHMSEGVARLTSMTGRPPRFFRPPYGSQNLASFFAAKRLGMEVIVWSADCDDWSEHHETVIAKRVIDAGSLGAVLLLHDTLAADPAEVAKSPQLDRKLIVELAVKGLADRGLRSVSLSTLLVQGEAHRTMWFRP